METREPNADRAEVGSYKEKIDPPTVARSVLRDLSPNDVLAAPTTQFTFQDFEDVSDDDDEDKNSTRRTQAPSLSTRASRYGKATVNHDVKYYPMDEVTRPKHAFHQRPGSGFESALVKSGVYGETSDETSSCHDDLIRPGIYRSRAAGREAQTHREVELGGHRGLVGHRLGQEGFNVMSPIPGRRVVRDAGRTA